MAEVDLNLTVVKGIRFPNVAMMFCCYYCYSGLLDSSHSMQTKTARTVHSVVQDFYMIIDLFLLQSQINS